MKRKTKVRQARAKQARKQDVAKEQPSIAFRLRDSYASLLLGLLVVVMGGLFLVWFTQSRKTATLSQKTTAPVENMTQESASPTETVTPTQIPSGIPQAKRPASLPENYTVADGDNLWSVAEKLYGSGYNWVDIARENKLEDAGYITVGMKLAIPNVAKKMISATNTVATASNDTMTPAANGTAIVANNTAIQPQQKSITADSYTITRGDDLWDIAVRAYGDGYRWVDIARANGLENPGLIHSDNVLKIPR